MQDGCYLAPGVTVVPPSHVNIGTKVGPGRSSTPTRSSAPAPGRSRPSAAAQIRASASSRWVSFPSSSKTTV